MVSKLSTKEECAVTTRCEQPPSTIVSSSPDRSPTRQPTTSSPTGHPTPGPTRRPTTPAPSAAPAPLPTAAAALKALYVQTGGAEGSWASSARWGDGDFRAPCRAFGVSCAAGGAAGDEVVVALGLQNNKLRGVLPSEVGALMMLRSAATRTWPPPTVTVFSPFSFERVRLIETGQVEVDPHWFP